MRKPSRRIDPVFADALKASLQSVANDLEIAEIFLDGVWLGTRMAGMPSNSVVAMRGKVHTSRAAVERNIAYIEREKASE